MTGREFSTRGQTRWSTPTKPDKFQKGRYVGLPLEVRCIIRFHVGANLHVRPCCEIIFAEGGFENRAMLQSVYKLPKLPKANYKTMNV